MIKYLKIRNRLHAFVNIMILHVFKCKEISVLLFRVLSLHCLNPSLCYDCSQHRDKTLNNKMDTMNVDVIWHLDIYKHHDTYKCM